MIGLLGVGVGLKLSVSFLFRYFAYKRINKYIYDVIFSSSVCFL